eukprot:scaffold388_cov244-Pinguiococcus_pyrenoidosus.AAC.14
MSSTRPSNSEDKAGRQCDSAYAEKAARSDAGAHAGAQAHRDVAGDVDPLRSFRRLGRTVAAGAGFQEAQGAADQRLQRAGLEEVSHHDAAVVGLEALGRPTLQSQTHIAEGAQRTDEHGYIGLGGRVRGSLLRHRRLGGDVVGTDAAAFGNLSVSLVQDAGEARQRAQDRALHFKDRIFHRAGVQPSGASCGIFFLWRHLCKATRPKLQRRRALTGAYGEAGGHEIQQQRRCVARLAAVEAVEEEVQHLVRNPAFPTLYATHTCLVRDHGGALEHRQLRISRRGVEDTTQHCVELLGGDQPSFGTRVLGKDRHDVDALLSDATPQIIFQRFKLAQTLHRRRPRCFFLFCLCTRGLGRPHAGFSYVGILYELGVHALSTAGEAEELPVRLPGQCLRQRRRCRRAPVGSWPAYRAKDALAVDESAELTLLLLCPNQALHVVVVHGCRRLGLFASIAGCLSQSPRRQCEGGRGQPRGRLENYRR